MEDNGLPRVEGLDAIIAESLAAEDKGQIAAPETPVIPQQDAPAEDGQAPSEMTEEEILAQFKSTKDLLKSYKEIQGFTTRVSQENKEKAKVIDELQARLNALQEEAELRRFQAAPQVQRPMTQKSFEEMFIENPEQAITSKATEIANIQRVREVLEEEANKNPAEYQERLAFVKMIAANPQLEPLTYSPKGVQKLFEIADRERKVQVERTAHQAMTTLFGNDYDLEKLRALIRKDGAPTITNQPTTVNPLHAYMPNTGTSTRTGQDVNTNVNDLERIKRDAVATGDADTVAGAILRQALLK